MIPTQPPIVYVGVDTHKDTHTAHLLDQHGRNQGTLTTPTTETGHQDLNTWAHSHGRPLWGLECTSTYGQGLTNHLLHAGEEVVLVARPNKKLRHRRGKTDHVDAEACARALLTGTGLVPVKHTQGVTEQLRLLQTVRNSAVKASAEGLTQLKSLLVTVPPSLREELTPLTRQALLNRCAHLRDSADPLTRAAKTALRSLARRVLDLQGEAADLEKQMEVLVKEAAPELLALQGVGVQGATTFLRAAGDNPERLTTSAGFALLCGVAPLEASSGKTVRHRLNRSGDRDANAALHRMVLTRLKHDPTTRDYMARRVTQGKSKREVIRCLKRYVAREVYQVLTQVLQRPSQPS